MDRRPLNAEKNIFKTIRICVRCLVVFFFVLFLLLFFVFVFFFCPTGPYLISETRAQRLMNHAKL